MSTRTVQTAVIGGGLAAFTAARTLADAGREVVMIHPTSPGATALWSGLGQIYGPAGDFLDMSTGLLEAPTRSTRSMVVSRQRRYRRLLDRRPFHPYQQLGLARADVASEVDRALAALNYPGIQPIGRELVFPSAFAAPYPADIAATSVVDTAIASGQTVGVVRCPSIADWHAERLAEALADHQTVVVRTVETPPFAQLTGTAEHSVKVASRLTDWVDGEAQTLLDALRGQTGQFDLLIVPPCLGRSWAEHRRLFAALRDGLNCRVAESAASRNSIHGWRLDRYLRGLTNIDDQGADNALDVVSSRASSGHVVDGRLEQVHTKVGAIKANSWVIATGRWIGGGLPTSAPLREPLLGVPVWVDGAPLPNADSGWPPDLVDRCVWDDHPLFRAGLATDDRLRPVDRLGEAVADNVFAAGRVLAGYHPFLDGSTLGVDLITGRRAALQAAEAADHCEVAP